MSEIWKPVADTYFSDYYEVSNLGNVRRLNKTKPPRLLTPTIANGYLGVLLSVNKYSERKNVHRLVGLAFLERINGKDIIDHINHNRQDNRLENLRWVDNRENQKNGGNYKGVYINTEFDKRRGTFGYRVNYYENNKRIRVGFATRSMAEQLYLLRGGSMEDL